MCITKWKRSIYKNILYDSFIILFMGFSNQSILKEINPEYSVEGLVLKLRLLKDFGHLK